MKKTVHKIGNSLGVYLDKDEIEFLKIEVGDMIEIKIDAVLLKAKKRGKKKC